ncbi:NAD(P)-dependent alcohol dehydrogenase [Roseivirga misakiensis]|uniref:Enoyl reductase (ER) domain-containing protein n=1 Tax=Roseivirga misakiensis TaxID=1563681 RepID=A0A1E5SY49_9BACT|nr:NAD(P)-dependent alcohol dehydrogenase [Roseivirga misakiensis]OEK04040.1 hypothetical protein BFP71_11130 [Roseivirga misakiensis]
MRAVVYKKYGDPKVLRLTELEKPQPKANELLVKVEASTVAAGDTRVRASDFPAFFWLPARLIFGLFKPKKPVLGHEFSGVVEAVGEEVSHFEPGDRVFGTTTLLKQGAYAEYVCVPQKAKNSVVAKAPESIDLKQAAALPIGAMTAFYLLEKAKLQKSNKILVYGASGSVGTYAVQMAKKMGAKVTGVCSTANVKMVEMLGAQKVIDYKKEDFSKVKCSYDVVFDAVGKTSKSKAKSVLNSGGRYVSINMFTSENTAKLKAISQMVDARQLHPFIDREYPLEEIVTAHRYVDTGRKRGNVLINLKPQ